jgi:pimeloyl-ACP methyl ester carboxylesterase
MESFRAMIAGDRHGVGGTRTRLHVEVHGPDVGPAIVLVHGAPDRSGTFKAVLDDLADRRVVVYDRRGYGRSGDVTPASAMLDHANDLLTIVRELDPPRVVVAHSFGSNPTMLAATIDPESFAAVGVWEPPMPWVEWWPDTTKRYNRAIAAGADPAAMIETMYRRLLGDATWEALPAAARARRRAEGAAFQLDMASELTAPFLVEEVTVPVLVGYGTATSPEHVRGALWLAEQLPDARLHGVEDAGHFAPRTHPGAYAAFVRAAAALGSR